MLEYAMLPCAAEIGDILSSEGIHDYVLSRGPVGRIDYPGLVACALPYPLLPDPLPRTGEEPFGLIANFARVHHYRLLSGRLKRARNAIIARLGRVPGSPERGKADFPIMVNSRADEKGAAALAGLGSIGLHSLVVTEKSGCACVLGLMGLPFAPEGAVPPRAQPMAFSACGDCGACMRACPTGAIRRAGGIDLDRCLQAYMSDDRPAPPEVEAAWGYRLYGCDDCLRACPYAFGSSGPPAPEPDGDAIGPAIGLASLLGSDDRALRETFKGTALGLSWLGPKTLRKNAEICMKSWLGE